MALLSGMERPTGGSVNVAGLEFDRLSEDQLAIARRGRIGIILQAFHLLPTMTALENVAVPMELAGMAEPFARAEEELTAVGLGHRLTHYPSQLSGGEQQRVAIAVGIANNPRVLLADEPTGELDDTTSAHVLEALRTVNRERGITTLIVTHDPGVSDHVARTVQIRDGRTSTEVLRSTRVDEHGAEEHIAEEYAVLDRVGRLQLPDEFVAALDLRDRVRLALEPDHVQVRPGERADAAAQTSGEDRP